MQPTKKAVGKTDQRNVITGDFPQMRRGRLRKVAKTLLADCRHYSLICHPELAIFLARGEKFFPCRRCQNIGRDHVSPLGLFPGIAVDAAKGAITQQCHAAVTGLF
jgi:hypothetical protein